MILGAYRNPPYRSPTRRSRPSSSASPPPGNGNVNNSSHLSNEISNDQNIRNQSPKRKRSHEEPFPSTPPLPISSLKIDTGISESGRPDGANSPRTKVAEKLKALDLEVSTTTVTTPESSQSPRKKAKKNSRLLGDGDVEIPEVRDQGVEKFLEVAETPGANERVEEGSVGSPSSPTRTKRLRSPPPPSPVLPAGQAPQLSPGNIDTSFSSSSSSSSSDGLSLTWRDDEITGHLMTCPDDDGEGINGVGFKPTPAIQYARSQKRRLQVEGWKAREAREARQRRIEKRRGGSGGMGSIGERKRSVRFVGDEG